MKKPVAVIVCVDYWDILELTIPYNHHNFSRIVVVTSSNQVIPLWIENYNITIHITDKFYENGAIFNKWAPLEQGLELAGDEWICILDADILIPQRNLVKDWGQNLLNTDRLIVGNLYTPLRRMCTNLVIPDETRWGNFPIHQNVKEWSGYFQLFHASDPVLGPRPWHETNWIHAGGADTFFQAKWPQSNKKRFVWEVLHLGLEGRNWCGRVTPHADGSVYEWGDVIEKRINKMREIGRIRQETGNYNHEKF